MLLLLTLLYIVSGHNWLVGEPSRGGIGYQAHAVRSPGRQRSAPNQPHRQVGQNQEMVIEWASGHTNSRYYFVILKSSDEDKLQRHTRGMLDDYINRAPSSAKKYEDKKWWKIHVSCNHHYPGNTRNRGQGCFEGNWNDGKRYVRELDKDKDKDYYINRYWHKTSRNMAQFEFSAAQRNGDARVEYQSDKYPWIEAVHRFKVADAKIPREWDAARFHMPARQGPGEYIVHMLWNGYRDAIDVYVLPLPAQDIYGSAAGKRMVKTEHCMYPNYSSAVKDNMKCFHITDGNVKSCLDECGRSNKCTAVNVVPLKRPGGVHSEIQGAQTSDVRAPWGSSNCKMPSANEITDSSFMCYGFIPGTPADPSFNAEAEPLFYISETDDEDPVFFSTCYREENGRQFAGNPGCAPCGTGGNMNLQRWQIGGRCLSCDAIRNWGEMQSDVNKINQWNVQEVCDKCGMIEMPAQG